jgi:anti-anti-sigma regulatory factor
MMAPAGAIDPKFNGTVGANRAVIVDLSNVAFKASLGIGLQVMGAKTGAKTITRKGGRLVTLSPENVHAVLETAGMEKLIPINVRSLGRHRSGRSVTGSRP